MSSAAANRLPLQRRADALDVLPVEQEVTACGVPGRVLGLGYDLSTLRRSEDPLAGPGKSRPSPNGSVRRRLLAQRVDEAVALYVRW